MDELWKLKRGMPVSDISNQYIGTVESVRPAAFVVQIHNGDPVLLRPDILYSVDDSTATVICQAGRIGEYLAET